MSGNRSLRDGFHRAIVGAGVVFGNPDDQAGYDQADQTAVEQGPPVEVLTADRRLHVAQCIADCPPDGRDRKNGGDKEALVHRAHDVVAAAQADEVGANDRGDDADAADQQRQRHQRHQVVCVFQQQRSQHHRGADSYDIGFEQVGCHARAVAHVVAHVVGDNGRVARVVLGNSCFDLAHQVGPDICRLGKDPAAQTREDRDERCSECQRGKRLDNGAVIAADGVASHVDQIVVEHRDGEQREAGHQHAGDRTGPEGQRQPLLQTLLGGSGGADVGADRDVHPDEACRARKHRADQKANRGNVAQSSEDDRCDNNPYDPDGGVLALQVGVCAFLDCGGDFLHAFVACRASENLATGDEAVDDGQQSQDNCDRD